MPVKDISSVKSVLERALDREPAERSAFIAEVCAGDDDLKHEVESLLEHEHREQPWSEGPIWPALSGDGAPEGFQPEQQVGPYRIVRGLGEGGMGEVALAVRQDDFEKQVALKIVKPGRLSEDFKRRFRNERQILAQLEHPNVARILDAGTTEEGRPFFAMEYVEGRPIDEHCEHEKLSIRQCLRLFLEVCSAIHFAHQYLIVHRDLKPRNILVTKNGVPKLLDFGIAKRLEPDANTELTHVAQRPMSLRYASPEQVDGRPITTGTDVYALGSLLYQLLARRHPHASSLDDTQALARAILEDEPRRPSAVVQDPDRGKRLAGDLDSIVLKAMRKDPGRRYGSVEQLADDVRRYLEGDPVLAREGTWSYRASKFARRHRRPLVAAAVLVIITIVFLVSVTMLWRQAVDRREQAEFEHQRAEQFLNLLRVSFRAAKPDRSKGEEVTARDILEQGEKNVDDRLDPLLQADLLNTIGDVYVDLGLYSRARAPWERAETLLRTHYRDGHPRLAWQINNVASWYFRSGEDYARAEELYREALAMKLQFPPDGEIDVAKSWSNLATILMMRGAFEEAEELYRRSLEKRIELHGEEAAVVATALRSLGVLYYTIGDLEQAEPLLRRSLELREKRYEPEDTRIATALTSLARLRHTQGRFDEAEQLLTRALEIRKARFDTDHPHIASCELDLARLYLDAGTPAKGAELLDRSLEILRKTKREGSWEVAEAESVLGGYLAEEGRFADAERYLTESYRTLVETRGARAVYARDAQRRLGQLYLAQGEIDKAAAYGVVNR